MYRTEQDALNALITEQKKTNELLEKLLTVLTPREAKTPNRRKKDDSHKQKSTSIRDDRR